ncbi:MAG: hypothetical protein H6684_01520 [Deltaproteobacteria bacterium]|nr:hypothetical protein [bacterium]MCB9476794.1 hypothetical protein [Deltaproteobacteria bacterium]MCB9487391.1 hypothetical protein [Deltaproteobacteria bacterium]
MSNMAKWFLMMVMVALLAGSVMVACGGGGDDDDDDDDASDDDSDDDDDSSDDDDDDDDSEAKVVYYGENGLQKVIYDKCIRCHTEDGVAPFGLEGYDNAEKYAFDMANETSRRAMPPENVDNSGECGHYDERNLWLTPEEMQMFQDFVAGGKAEGNALDSLTLPPPLPGLPEEDRNMVLQPDEPYLPDASKAVDSYDDYHCWLIDPKIDKEMYVTAYEAVSDNESIVHHTVVIPITTKKAELYLTYLQDVVYKDQTGWPCSGTEMGGEGLSSFLSLSGPGGGASYFPEGTGQLIKPGQKIAYQIHYHLEPKDPNDVPGKHWSDDVEPDASPTYFKLEESVEKPATMRVYRNTDLFLPPGMENIDETTDIPLDQDYEIWGVAPHMHELGSTYQLDLIRADGEKAGEPECMARVVNWDFDWQGLSTMVEPIMAKKGDTMRLSCRYNTEDRETTTYWGEGSKDEMCIAWVYMVPLGDGGV